MIEIAKIMIKNYDSEKKLRNKNSIDIKIADKRFWQNHLV